jgi:choline dehydrogenase-like flavoprotein
MFVDCRRLDTEHAIDAEVCIIGAGAAGITLALELANKPYRVCLLESGGLTPDPETTSLNEAVNVGRAYSTGSTRLRYFGGTTGHWGGHCVPIRTENFEPRAWIRNSGWDLTRRELDPYYRRAHEVLDLGDFDYGATNIAASLNEPIFPFDSSRVESVGSRYNPMRFGSEYRDDLDRASNVTTYLYANVSSIDRHPTNSWVEGVSVKTINGKSFTCRAKHYVLATGGIENARLLLLSDRVEAAGLGNTNGLVGRFFMEHLFYPSGLILPSDQSYVLDVYTKEFKQNGTPALRCHIALPHSLVSQLQIPAFRAELQFARTDRFYESVASAGAIKEDLANLSFPDDLSRHLGETIRDPGPVLRRIFGKGPPLVYLLANHVEQVPNPDSRVTLSPQKDLLGLNKAALDWRLSEIDKLGIARAQTVIAAEVGRSGFGRMRIELPDEEAILLERATPGSHHMGTTRMDSNPREGVVDTNCRVHGLSNLFIAGSSVFPCCGYANPTLTIVALALRLGDHLDEILRRSASARRRQPDVTSTVA